MTITVSDDFLWEIGRVAVLQSHIEGGLRLVITSLAGLENTVGDALTKPLSFRHLVEITESLLKLRSDSRHASSHRTELLTLIRRACHAEARRNQIVHSMWSFGPDGISSQATRLKLAGSPPSLSAHVESVADLTRLAQEMEQIVQMLTYLHPFLRQER